MKEKYISEMKLPSGERRWKVQMKIDGRMVNRRFESLAGARAFVGSNAKGVVAQGKPKHRQVRAKARSTNPARMQLESLKTMIDLFLAAL